MKAFVITSMTAGMPDFSGLPFNGCVLCAKTPNRAHGIYIVTGTSTQFAAGSMTTTRLTLPMCSNDRPLRGP